MTWPSVDINQLNQRQGEIAGIERIMLFVGHASKALGDKSPMRALNAQSDIDESLSEAGSVLLENVRAAQLNAGQNWSAYAMLLEPDDDNWTAAITAALSSVSVEGVLVCAEISEKSVGRTLINQLHALRASVISNFGRWIWFIATVAGPLKLPTKCAWEDYRLFINDLTKDIAANSVQLVPSLWGNEAGVLSGRLCNRAVTIADSPARVETGELLGMGIGSSDLPVDADGVEVSLAGLKALHDLRCSVPMWYSDYEGLYWSDGLMLEVKGGDFEAIEYLRVADKVARNTRIRAIGKIANRNLNTTPSSIETHQTYFAGILREMAKTLQINGVTFPGEVESPKEGDVLISWTTKTRVAIVIVVRPYACPKEITVSIVLDRSLEDDA